MRLPKCSTRLSYSLERLAGFEPATPRTQSVCMPYPSGRADSQRLPEIQKLVKRFRDVNKLCETYQRIYVLFNQNFFRVLSPVRLMLRL